MVGHGPRERLGESLQQRLDALEERAGTDPAGAITLGVGLGVMVVAGGIGLFIVIWAVLVGLLH